MKKKINIVKLIMSALFAALTCIFTMLPMGIPSLTQGYIHFGDCFVLLSGWYLGPYGVLAAGIGSMLTDILGGYLIYAPATLIIKGVVALIAALFLKLAANGKPFGFRLLGGVVAELFMAVGYYLYSATVMGYGFIASAAEIPNNLVQGGVGVAAAILLAQIIDTTGVLKKLK